MNSLNKKQSTQDQEYSFPYHYIPQKNPNFSQHLYWSWGVNYQATLDFLINQLKKDSFNSLIDIGTGDGRLVKELVQAFPRKKIMGVDYSTRAINLAKALNPKLNFKTLNIQKQKIGPQFSRATLIEVLEHVPKNQVKSFIKSCSNLLSLAGVLYLTVPHKNMPLQKKHVQHFDLKTLKKYLDPYFNIKQIQYLGKQSWQYQLILMLLGNSFFILNHQGLRNLLFSFYKHHLFITTEPFCSRIYLKLVKK